MSCNGCYNGCSEVTSDNCVKYTGVNIEALGITSGDTLAMVETAIIQYLQSALDGSGISWTVDPAKVCALIDGYLPAAPYTLIDIINATFDAICDLQTQVTAAQDAIDTLNADYTVDCLAGVTDSSDTHDVLQAAITALCTLTSDLQALTLDLNNYVLVSDIDDYIAAYLSGISPPSTQHYLKMIPYVAVEYYGDLSGFDATGAGISGTDWENIYLCNGENGTPDKRGMIPIGTTDMAGNNPLDALVDPALGNHTYPNPGVVHGVNNVILTTGNLPPHKHESIASVNEDPHSHVAYGTWGGDNGDLSSWPKFAAADIVNGAQDFTANVSSTKTYLSVTMTNPLVGLGESHTNVPVVKSCYYIMYIP